MTTTLIIAARELRERKFVFMAAAVLAVVPFVAALLPMAQRFGPAAFIAGAAGILAALYTVAVAIGLGGSMLARELSDRRLSFYFARPVGAASIWFGKLAGATAITALSFAIIFGPALLLGSSAWSITWPISAAEMVAAVLLVSAFVLLLSHAINTMVRSRSALLAVDLVMAAVVAAGAVMVVSPLFEAMALKLTGVMAGALAITLFAVLVASGAWQVSRGRAEIRRSHAEMSKFLWISLVCAVAVAGGYVAWVLSAEPEDLTVVYAEQNPSGDWAALGGHSRFRGDYFPMFLMNLQNRQWVKFSNGRWSDPQFTRAGNAALMEKAPGDVVAIYRFGIDEEPVTIDLGGRGTVVLSDDAERMAVISDRTVSITDIDSKRLVASARIAKGDRARAFFVSPDVLRIIRTDDRSFEIFELDATTRQLTRTGGWSSPSLASVQANHDGSALLASIQHSSDAVVLDGRTAEVRATVSAKGARRFLHDGRIAVVTDGTLKLFSPAGSELHNIDIGPVRTARFGGMTNSGLLVVTIYNSQEPETIVVDTDKGNVVRREPGLAVQDFWWWHSDPRVAAPNTGPTFIVRDDGVVWRWNALTGERENLL